MPLPELVAGLVALGVPEADVHAYWRDLESADSFFSALRALAAEVPEFREARFVRPLEDLRVFRCLLYLIVRISRPMVVVETGMLDGLGSACILLALEHNGGCGRLWSIDCEPTPEIVAQGTRPLPKGCGAGWLIPSWLRSWHDVLVGKSKDRLDYVPRPFDMFIHDSDHRYVNTMFELCHAWLHLSGGGWIVCDNTEQTSAFDDFVRSEPEDLMATARFRSREAPLWEHGVARSR